jgi:hypothetical protein
MAKPPADANPEHFIIGQGVYNNLQIASPYDDAEVFRINPTPMPVWSIVIFNALIAAFFYGFHWIVKNYAEEREHFFGAYVMPVGIGLMTCLGVTAVVYYSFNKARRLGPWLIFYKATGQVELSREKISFDRQDIVHLQYITTKRLDWGGVVNNGRLSELNLITCHNGERKRWPLLRSIFTSKSFEHILKPLISKTDLPVVRIEDQWLGWKTTMTIYGGRTSEMNQLTSVVS